MAVSGIGIIESGIGGSIPNHIPNFYTVETPQYQLPCMGVGQGFSSSDEFANNTIVENQLVGISRTHTRLDAVTFQGVFVDASNYSGTNQFFVSVSGIEAYIGNVYVGHNPQVYSWSGLSNGGINYLWISMVEQANTNLGYLSSRQFRDFECRSTLTTTQPVGPQASVLVATYTSGQGITVAPKLVLVGDHVSNNINPHGTFLNVNTILTSGVVVMGLNRWPYAAVNNMAPSGIPFSNVTYNNQLFVPSGTTLIASGLFIGTQSGTLNFSLISNISSITSTAGIGLAGFVSVASGVGISGSGTFRNTMVLTSGLTVDGLQFGLIQPQLIDGRQLSGIPLLHTHSLNAESVSLLSTSPQYPGSVYFPPEQTSFGLGTGFPFEYNNDLGAFNPTLRAKAQYSTNLYIRAYMPPYYNKLDSINIKYSIDSGSNPILVNVRDCIGNLFTPIQGGILSGIGPNYMTVSGFPQAGFSQNMPFDLEVAFNGISGTSQYLGDVIFSFVAQNP